MQFVASVVRYDDGYLSDDKTLASAVWRNLLNKNEKAEPSDLLHLVEYIHKNLHHLESLPDEQFINGVISFIGLDNEKVDKAKDQHVRRLVVTM